MVYPVMLEVRTKTTGNFRVRRGWFGRLILQAEWSVDRVCGLDKEYNVKTIWRDARPEDVGLSYSANIKLTN